jgi:RNA polymerase sigma-70 factor (ECF subfamily)
LPAAADASAGAPGGRLSDTSDPALIEGARAGDSGAFDALVKRYQALVCLVAYRQLGQAGQIEDVAQEAFVKAFLHLHELDDPRRFKSWLLRIAANLCLDHLRRRKHQGLSLDETATFHAAEAAAAAHPRTGAAPAEGDAQVQADEVRTQVVEAIYSLPEEYQLPAAMRYLEGIPYREIARRLGLREEALRKRIHRASQMLRRKLRKLLPGQEEA